VYLGYAPAATLKLRTKASYGAKSSLKNSLSYAWNAGAGLAISPETLDRPQIQLTATRTGNYESKVTLAVTDGNGCSNEKEFKIRVIDARCSQNKILVCKGKNSSASTVCVSPKEVNALLVKGGSLGSCQ
jgi:hypothetical protein